MKVQHNISALNTFRQMGINNTGTTKSLEKLSSGYKINRAGDDAAGLAISEKMRAQIKGLNRASANALDGISLIQAAEGALQETHSILQRMRELGIQAANDVNETEDRSAIQDELNQLKTELNRIANTTEFNKKTVLDGSLKTGAYATKILAGTSVMAGAYIDPNFAATKFANGDPVAGIYTVAMEAGSEGATVTRTWEVDLTGMVAGETVSAKVTISNTDRAGGEQTENDVLTFTSSGIGDVDNATFINQLKEALQKVVKDYTISTSGNTVTFTGKGIGEGWQSPELEFTFNTDSGSPTKDGSSNIFEILPADATINISFNDPNGSTDAWTVDTEPSNGLYKNGMFSDIDQSGLVFEWADLTTAGSTILQVVEGKNLTFQTGANTGKHQTIEIGIKAMSAASLGVDNIRVDTHLSSQATVAAIENAIQTVSTQRGELGSVQNRLEHTIANLDTIAENLQDAESRIRDTDMAKEMMEFTKFNILNQASQAMMAQANSLPQGVLQLLR